MLYFHEKTADGFNARQVSEVLCLTRTKFQEVAIVKHPNLGRTLYLDSCFQADDVFEDKYHEFMVDLAYATKRKSPTNILVCGSGPGGLAKVCLQKFPDVTNILNIELDVEAYHLFRIHVPDWGVESPKVETIIGDAFAVQLPRAFDVVFWDMDADTLSEELLSSESVKKLASKLISDGVFVATTGYKAERQKQDKYEIFKKSLVDVFPKGQFHDYPELTWTFFSSVG